jgi:hypothetical protein
VAVLTEHKTDEEALVTATGDPAADDERVRQLAIKQIERKRRFFKHAISYVAVCVLLAVIWAISEYHNAGGWPTKGFSQSSSIPHEWNIWIIYPVLGLGFILAIEAWNTFARKPITESEIQREIDRLKRGR